MSCNWVNVLQEINSAKSGGICGALCYQRTLCGADADNGSISVYRSAFSTYRETAKLLVHEFGHAISRYTVFFANNSRYNDWNTSIALDEVYAYSFQDRFGFSFYQHNSKFYLYGLQSALNKL